MKKILNFLFPTYLVGAFVFIFAITLSSCGPLEQQNPKVKSLDTLITTTCYYQVPVTAPRWSCTGAMLPNPKIIRWEKDSCTTYKLLHISESDLKDNSGVSGVTTDKSEVPETDSGLWTKKDTPWWLLLLAGIILSALFYLLGKNSEEKKSSSSTPPANPNPPSSPVSGSRKEESDMLVAVMKGMKDNGINHVAAEFPNGPRITLKSNPEDKKSTGSIDLRKGKEKPDAKKSDTKKSDDKSSGAQQGAH